MINVERVGHVGILAADVERSLEFYTKVLGLTITFVRREPNGEAQAAFLRCQDMHHDFAIHKAPPGVDPTAFDRADRLIQRIAFLVEDRDAFLRALTHVRSLGVEIIRGPFVHGFEGDGRDLAGSGSRSFSFLDPDGNPIEIYTGMMRVPFGEQFPRKEYADLFELMKSEAEGS